MAIEMSQHRAGLYNPCYGVLVEPVWRSLQFDRRSERAVALSDVTWGEEGLFCATEPSGGSDPARAIQTRGFKDGSECAIWFKALYRGSIS